MLFFAPLSFFKESSIGAQTLGTLRSFCKLYLSTFGYPAYDSRKKFSFWMDNVIYDNDASLGSNYGLSNR